MKNKWKYASLGEAERLDMIKNGNYDVYNAEKARNKELKKLRSDLGLSTDIVDSWDSVVDGANAEFTKVGKSEKNSLPKFTSGRLDEINNQLRSDLKDLRKQRDESIKAANSDAEQALGYISEWLASNGYSKDGSFSVESRTALKQALESMLRDIEDNYQKQVKSTVSMYRSMA